MVQMPCGFYVRGKQRNRLRLEKRLTRRVRPLTDCNTAGVAAGGGAAAWTHQVALIDFIRLDFIRLDFIRLDDDRLHVFGKS
jgi:hypothetical protein